VKCLPFQFEAYVQIDGLSGHGKGFDKGLARQHIPCLPTWSSNLRLREDEEGRNIQHGTWARRTTHFFGHWVPNRPNREGGYIITQSACNMPKNCSRQPRGFRWNLHHEAQRATLLVTAWVGCYISLRSRPSSDTRKPKATSSSVMPSVKGHVPQI